MFFLIQTKENGFCRGGICYKSDCMATKLEQKEEKKEKTYEQIQVDSNYIGKKILIQ